MRVFFNLKYSIATITAVLILGGVWLFGAGAVKKHFLLSQFINPAVCGGCHSDIYSQWKGSSHALAHADELYLAVAKGGLLGLADRSEIAEAESCVKCHTPVGFVTGFPRKTSDDLTKTPKIAQRGVQCDFCHSAVSARKIGNGDLDLDPGKGMKEPGIKRGPFADSKAEWHQSAYSEFHTSAKLCGTCHNVTHVVFGTVLEDTYGEWTRSPYNTADPLKRVTCQGCHMHQKPGVPSTGSTARPLNPGQAAPNAPERNHLFTHYFVGGNTWLGRAHQSPGQADMARERLEHAAAIRIAAFNRASGELTLKLLNNGAGHSIPTGVANIRQVWVRVTVSDSSGKIIFTSGHEKTGGNLPASAITYGVTFGDGKGNRVDNIAQAREILRDVRLEPLVEKTEVVKIPPGLLGAITVRAELMYRVIDPAVLAGMKDREYPVIEAVIMASDRKSM